MDTTLHMVTLANGKQVSWEEFSTWSIFKQNGSLSPAVKPGTVKGKREVTQAWNLVQSHAKSLAHKASFFNDRKITRNFGITNGSSRSVMTPLGQFPSRVSAAKHFCVSTRKMYDWIRSDDLPDFYYTEHSNVRPQSLGSRSVATPYGSFPSIEETARYYKVTAKTIKDWIKNKPDSLFRYDIASANNNLIPGSKPLMTSAGKFPSLKMASDHFGIQEATIKKWIKKSRPGFYFL